MEEFYHHMVGLNLNNCCDSDIWLPNTLQEKYECHWGGVFEKVRCCFYCGQCRPAMLEELAFSSILKNPELLKKAGSALSHLPDRLSCLIGHALNTRYKAEASQLVAFVNEYKTQMSWFRANNSAIDSLFRFRFYAEVYQKLKPFMESPSKGIEEVLQYLSDFDNTYEDFWSAINSAMKTLKAEIDLGVFKNIISTEENNVVPVNIFQLRGRAKKYPGNVAADEYVSMKELQRLNKTTACPVFFQATSIEHRLGSHEIPHLLEDMDPQLVSEVLLTNTSSWSVADVDALEEVLSVCSNFSCIYLAQIPKNRETPEDAAEAILRLLSNRPQLSELCFSSMTLGGALGKFPLPASVDKLCLVCCKLTEPGLEAIASRSDLALKHLEVYYSLPGYHFHGLYDLIHSQAKSLESLFLDFHLLSPVDLVELLKLMAKFDKLQRLHLVCFFDVDLSYIENIVLAFMSIRCAKSFFIDFACVLDENGVEMRSRLSRLLEVMKSPCTLNRRPPIYLKLAQVSKPRTVEVTFWSN